MAKIQNVMFTRNLYESTKSKPHILSRPCFNYHPLFFEFHVHWFLVIIIKIGQDHYKWNKKIICTWERRIGAWNQMKLPFPALDSYNIFLLNNGVETEGLRVSHPSWKSSLEFFISMAKALDGRKYRHQVLGFWEFNQRTVLNYLLKHLGHVYQCCLGHDVRRETNLMFRDIMKWNK